MLSSRALRRLTVPLLLAMIAGCGPDFDALFGGAAAADAGSATERDGSPDAAPQDAGGTSPIADAACPTTDAAGHWTGKFTPDRAFLIGVGDSQADLQQNCSVITGWLSVQGCFTNGNVTGTIYETGAIDATVTSGEHLVSLKGRLATRPDAGEGHPRLEGNYTYVQGKNCLLNDGTFQIDRQ